MALELRGMWEGVRLEGEALRADQENKAAAALVLERDAALVKYNADSVAAAIQGTGLNAFSGLRGWPYRS